MDATTKLIRNSGLIWNNYISITLKALQHKSTQVDSIFAFVTMEFEAAPF
jgi:hypothetical protein